MSNGTDESVTQGDTAVLQATLTDTTTGNLVDDVSAEYRFTAKRSYADADADAVYSTTAAQSTAGVAFLTIDPTAFAALSPPAVLVYDVKVRETSGRVSTVAKGKLIVLPAVRDVMP